MKMTEPLENRVADEVVSLMRDHIPVSEHDYYDWGTIWRGARNIVQEQASQPPAGYTLVPIEPTKEMLKAVATNVEGGGLILPSWRAEMYRAMLAAAPNSN